MVSKEEKKLARDKILCFYVSIKTCYKATLAKQKNVITLTFNGDRYEIRRVGDKN